MTKKTPKYETFEITEEEFYGYTKDMPLLYKETKKGEEYELFGPSNLDPMKYKNYQKDGKDAFCIYQRVPQEIACGNCSIKIHSEVHEGCPVCKKTFRTMIEDNRKFNDSISDKKAKMNQDFQDEYLPWLKELCIECNQDYDMVTMNG